MKTEDEDEWMVQFSPSMDGDAWFLVLARNRYVYDVCVINLRRLEASHRASNSIVVQVSIAAATATGLKWKMFAHYFQVSYIISHQNSLDSFESLLPYSWRTDGGATRRVGPGGHYILIVTVLWCTTYLSKAKERERNIAQHEGLVERFFLPWRQTGEGRSVSYSIITHFAYQLATILSGWQLAQWGRDSEVEK